MHEDDVAQREFVNDPERMKAQSDWERRYLGGPMLAALLVVAGVLLTGCAPAGPHFHNAPGGSVQSHFDKRFEYERSGRQMTISGHCTSACVILAASPNACLMPGTVLRAHGVHSSPTPELDQRSNEIVADHLPSQQAHDFFLDVVVPTTTPFTFVDISYEQALSYGFRGC